MKQIIKTANPFFGWRGPGTQNAFVYYCGMHLIEPWSKLTASDLMVENGESLPPHDGIIKTQFDGRWRSQKFWLPETIFQFQQRGLK